jgi:endonuclease III
MRKGTLYARKIKRLCARLKKGRGVPEQGDPVDPVNQLLLGILHRGTSVSRAERVLARIRSAMVDLNELRVSTPSELVLLLGSGFPHATEKAKTIVNVLNQVFGRYHDLSLDALKVKGKRDARQYLEHLEGVDAATVAGVMLLSLEGHAVPVDEIMLRVLREDGLVDPKADVKEVQGFLERNVSAAKAHEMTVLLRRYSEDRIKRIGVSKSTPRGRAKPTKKRAAASKGRPRRVSKTSKKRTGRTKARSAASSSRTGRSPTKRKKSPSGAARRRAAGGKRRATAGKRTGAPSKRRTRKGRGAKSR